MLVLSTFCLASARSIATTGFGVVTVCIIILCLYRLYFAPLAQFPGPTLAAITSWYEFYYDVIHSGQYQFKIQELHKRYGPIIRITPSELHIDDPEFYDELYVGPMVRKTDKFRKNMAGFGDNQTSAFDTIPFALHRSRRAALNNFFSKKSVNELAPFIQAKIERLCQRLKEFKGTGIPVNLVHAFSAFTVDVITDYAFSKTMGNLEASDFDPTWFQAMRTVNGMYNFGTHFPLVMKLLFNLPEAIVKIVSPNMTIFPRLTRLCRDNIEDVRRGDNSFYETAGHQTIFHSLIWESDLPPEEKTTQRLTGEGISLVTAGSITTAEFLTRTTFELLSKPSALERLREELAHATSGRDASPLSVAELENLPYLRSVVNEGHRVTYGIPHRLMRVSPFTAVQYKNWSIPAGTPVGMSSLLMHDNPNIFPEPHTFIPERWLKGDQEGGRRLEKYLVPFSKGSRQCLGINLAHAEIYLTLCQMFRPGGVGERMTLWETERNRDVAIVRDWFVPVPGEHSRGVRVLVE